MTESTGFTFTVVIDWDNDGSWATSGDDITADVKSVSVDLGFTETQLPTIANVGRVTLVLDNSDKKYSPKNTGSSIFGKMIPGLPIAISVTYGANVYTLFIGVTENFTATSSVYGQREATITAVDLMAKFQNSTVNIPTQPNSLSSSLVKNIVQYVLKGAVATGSWTINTTPADGDTITLTDGETGLGYTWTLKTTLSGANQILIGANQFDCAQNIVAAINRTLVGVLGPGAFYSASSYWHNLVYATLSTNVVTLHSLRNGATGNLLETSKNSTHITAGGAFTGGADKPAAPYAPSIQAGTIRFDTGGDSWASSNVNGEGGINALSALEDVCKSEFGMLWVSRGGILTFKNKEFIQRAIYTYNSTLDINSQFGLDGELTLDDIHNQITINYTPRNTLASGVIATLNSVVAIPPTSAAQRWDTTTPPDPQSTIMLPFTDPTTGAPIGLSSLVLPPTPGASIIFNTKPDGTGTDLTSQVGYAIFISYAISSTRIELTISNAYGSTIYVTHCQFTGSGYAKYNPLSIRVDDASSQTLYGIKEFSDQIPLQVSQELAIERGQYILAKMKNGFYRIHSAEFQNHVKTVSSNAFAFEIGDVIGISDTQTALASEYYMVIGLSYQLSPGKQYAVSARLLYVGYNNGFWVLDTSLLGFSTILGF